MSNVQKNDYVQKNSMSKKYSLKNPFSLSKGSNYPSSICKMASKKVCPKNLFAILAKFSSICEILAMFKTNSIVLKYPRRIRQFQGVWIFSWILRKHWFILSFLYSQQWLASSLDKNLFHVRLGHNFGMLFWDDVTNICYDKRQRPRRDLWIRLSMYYRLISG